VSLWFFHSGIQLCCKNFCPTYCAPSGESISNHECNESYYPSFLLRDGGVSCRDGLKMKKEDQIEEHEEFRYSGYLLACI